MMVALLSFVQSGLQSASQRVESLILSSLLRQRRALDAIQQSGPIQRCFFPKCYKEIFGLLLFNVTTMCCDEYTIIGMKARIVSQVKRWPRKALM